MLLSSRAFCSLLLLLPAAAAPPPSASLFTLPFPDPGIHDALASACGLVGDGIADDTLALQCAVNLTYSAPGATDCTVPGRHVVALAGSGRAYRVTSTIYLPMWARLVGYGATRPLIRLAPATPGFSSPFYIPLLQVINWASPLQPQCNVSRFFGGNTAFGTGVLNIDFELGAGNPAAVAISNGAAQGGTLASLRFDLAPDAAAAVANPGWAHSDLVIVGGRAGVIVNHTGAWPSLFRDCYFSGQGNAAIVYTGYSAWEGITVLRGTFEGTAQAVDASAVASARLTLVDCRFPATASTLPLIRPPALANSSILLVNCSGGGGQAAQVLVARDGAGVLPVGGLPAPATAAGAFWTLQRLVVGWLAGDLRSAGAAQARLGWRESGGGVVDSLPALPPSDIPPYPPMQQWQSVAEHGIVPGDGAGNTSAALGALLAAAQPGAVFYFPLGVYVLEAALVIPADKGLTLLGLHCWDVALTLADNVPGFMDPGALLPVLHVPATTSSSSSSGPWLRGMNIQSGRHFGVAQPPPVPAGWFNPNPGALALLWEARSGGLEDAFFHPPTFPDNPRLGSGVNSESTVVVRGAGAALVAGAVWSCNAYSSSGVRVEGGAVARLYQLSSEHHMGHELHVLGAGSAAQVLVMQTEDRSPDAAPTSSVCVEGGGVAQVSALFSYYAAKVPSPGAVLVDAESSAVVSVFRQYHSYHPMFYNCSVLAEGGNSSSACLALTDFAEAGVGMMP